MQVYYFDPLGKSGRAERQIHLSVRFVTTKHLHNEYT